MEPIILVFAFMVLVFAVMVLPFILCCSMKRLERRIKTAEVRRKEATSTDFEVQGVPEKLHF